MKFDDLNKLPKAKLEAIYDELEEDIKRADQYYESEIEPALLIRRKAYEAEPSYYESKFPGLSRITDLTSSDVADTIEWAMPTMMRTFFSGEDVVTLMGVSEEDDESAQVMQQLINYQLLRHNSFFIKAHDWFKNSFIENVGVLKCYWDRQVNVEETYEIYLNQIQVQELQNTPGIEVTLVEPTENPEEFRVEYDVVSVVKNQPVIECVPASELRFSPEARNIDEAEYVAHRKIVTADYLKRKEMAGVYHDIKEALEDADNIEYTQYEQDTNEGLNMFGNRKETGARKKVILYECYVKLDVNDDDLLEDLIVTVVNKTIVRIAYNTMGRHPFFLISPIRDPQKIWASKGICDLISQLQDLKTVMLRQVVANVAKNNDKQAFVNVDMLVDVREFIEGKKAVRVNGDPRLAVFWTPIEQLSPQVFDFLEYIEILKESRTGITRYNQGMQADTLNKTATGITQIMNASNQRLELIARMFMEDGFTQLFRFLIRLNQQFIDDAVVIRITGKSKTISPDDLQGEIDVIINAGLGISGKQQIMQNLQMLLSIYPQLLQMGAASPIHVAFVVGKMVEEMGWKNKQEFVFTPEQIQQNMMAQQQQQMMMMQQQQAMQQQQMEQQAAMQQQEAEQRAALENRKQDSADAQMQHQQLMDVAGLQNKYDDQKYLQGQWQQESALQQLKLMLDYVARMKGGSPNAARR